MGDDDVITIAVGASGDTQNPLEVFMVRPLFCPFETRPLPMSYNTPIEGLGGNVALSLHEDQTPILIAGAPWNDVGSVDSAGQVIITQVVSPVPDTFSGDLTEDGKVNIQDIKYLFTDWGRCKKSCKSDLVQDSVVDVKDFLRLLNYWR